MTRKVAVGVTAVGSGIGQPVLDSLRASSLPVRIVGFDASPWAKGAFDCDAAFLLPSAGAPSYAEAVLARCAQAGLDLLIPGSDPELIPLAELAGGLERLGCRLLASDPRCVRLCRDKLALHHHASALGAPFVPTWPAEEARARAHELVYPMVLKPARGSGSQGVRVLLGPSDWPAELSPGAWVVQPHLVPESTLGGREPMACSWDEGDGIWRPLQQDELSVQFFVAPSGKVLGRFASLNVLKAGVVVCVNPVDDPRVWTAAEEMLAALLPLGPRGPLNLQGRITRSGVIFYEANPRFTGITHVRTLSGYREVEAAVRSFVLREPDEAVAALLQTRTDRVGLRQMTETVVPRARVRQLEAQRALGPAPPLEEIVVTGASGYLGAALTFALLERQVARRVVAVVRDPERARSLWAKSPPADRIELLGWDAFAHRPAAHAGVVVHCAGLREGSDAAGLYRANVDRTTTVVERAAAGARLVYISSQSVYGTRGPVPYLEDSPLAPETPYALSKAAGEAIVRTRGRPAERWTILRLARLYGLGQAMRWEELPHKFAALARAGDVLPVFGGDQLLDLLHLRDAVEAILSLLAPGAEAWDRVYNIGSGAPVAVTDLARVCVEVARARRLPPARVQQSPRERPPPLLGLDISRARASLGWEPRVGLADGIAELLAAEPGG